MKYLFLLLIILVCRANHVQSQSLKIFDAVHGDTLTIKKNQLVSYRVKGRGNVKFATVNSIDAIGITLAGKYHLYSELAGIMEVDLGTAFYSGFARILTYSAPLQLLTALGIHIRAVNDPYGASEAVVEAIYFFLGGSLFFGVPLYFIGKLIHLGYFRLAAIRFQDNYEVITATPKDGKRTSN